MPPRVLSGRPGPVPPRAPCRPAPPSRPAPLQELALSQHPPPCIDLDAGSAPLFAMPPETPAPDRPSTVPIMDPTARSAGAPAPWLLIIDPQRIFADPGSDWASPFWEGAWARIRELAAQVGPERTVVSRWLPTADRATSCFAMPRSPSTQSRAWRCIEAPLSSPSLAAHSPFPCSLSVARPNGSIAAVRCHREHRGLLAPSPCPKAP